MDVLCTVTQTPVNTSYTHSFGFFTTSNISASRVPMAGSCMYSHLGMKGTLLPGNHRRTITDIREKGDVCVTLVLAYLAVRGRDMIMLSILEPGVARPNFTPLSYTRLNSTYLQINNTHYVTIAIN